MSQVRRLLVGTGLIVSMLIVALVYIRAGLPLMARAAGGPFSAPVELLRVVIPVIIGGIILATSAWIVFGPVQQEKSRTVERRRR